MPLKENMKPLILVAPETQVDVRNRPEDQLLARQLLHLELALVFLEEERVMQQ